MFVVNIVCEYEQITVQRIVVECESSVTKWLQVEVVFIPPAGVS